ncbi:hypothetical protein AB0P12_25480 [Streptomyces subrutilus]|uniref:Uncharacterized protein n=1 Tax=Streptomyces subrutilus TaxID=36818 RepID=A0A5P2UDY2_9ACTN|nr:hypothetical protein [Streptomyces subrutilus]QEU77496.1 hypothetical protein CP968_03620 [Streptomyces subrutilus]WSJ33415.1 hypothetical protein OG479_31225 [Streptomyces subrutilus]GGZ47976.1 hypothetical protein GCM10010371_04170 [Streptomyces subrutilus]
MRAVRPAAVALLGLAVTLTALTGAAHASQGPFGWTGAQDKPFFVEDIPDGKCFTMSEESRGAHNGTKTPVTVFAGKDCKGKALRLAPGQKAPRNATFSSLRFGN